MNWVEFIDWLIKTVSVGTVAGAAYWLLNQAKVWVDQRPVIWAVVRVRKSSHNSWVRLQVRNRAPFDLYIEDVKVIEPKGLKLEGRSGNPKDKVRVDTHIGPCAPYAVEMPSELIELRCGEPVSVIEQRVRLSLTFRTTRRFFDRRCRTVSAIVSREP